MASIDSGSPLTARRPSPVPAVPPPEFDLEWRAIAFVMEAGSEGVDAEAVKTALLALEPVEHGDGRPIMRCVVRAMVD